PRKRRGFTQAERIERSPARPALPAAGDRGHDGDFVPILEFGLFPFEEANIFRIDVDIDKASQVAFFVVEALPYARIRRLQAGQQLLDRRPLRFDLTLAFSQRTQKYRNSYLYSHVLSAPPDQRGRFRTFTIPHACPAPVDQVPRALAR